MTFSPAKPTVGDVITVIFPNDVQRIANGPSAEYELLRTEKNRLTLRTFKPGPLTLKGKVTRATGTRDLTLNLLIHSVLQPNDTLEPAELKPPVQLPVNHLARGAIAAAAGAALIAWATVFLLFRGKKAEVAQPSLSAREEFRAALVRADRMRDSNLKLIFLADATRVYLSRAEPRLRRELTTFELLRLLPPGETAATLREVLSAADLAKFSPWGSEAAETRITVDRLRRLPDLLEPEEKAA